jgi:TPR repeat protein
MEITMKTGVITVCLLVLFALEANAVYAKEAQEYRAEADQYYAANNYRKAYKNYLKLAKQGDHYSQDRIAQMYANGEGKKVDLSEAYAWSVLAAESGTDEFTERRDELLQQTTDESAAQKKADKLMGKYGEAALAKKAASKERLRRNTKSGGCTGSRLDCR